MSPPRICLTLLQSAFTLVMLLATRADAYCTFPVEWRGQWHQNNIGDVIVSENEISRKGRCVESKYEYFLLENRDVGCFTCIQTFVRHKYNIIQYKESYCVGKDALISICRQIQITSITHTLIREPSVPIPCPFHDAYHFSYNNNSGGFCREPTSYAKPCASGAQIRLHFRHCSNAAYTYEREADLECLGTWKEGSEQYMIGMLTGDGFRSKDQKYRCFMYDVFGTLIYSAMSSDASCFGVISPRNGPILLEFTQDVFGWPMPSCEFPDWISHQSWQDLSGRHVFETNTDGTIVTELFKQEVTSQPAEQKAYRCHKVLERNTTDDEFTLVSFTLNGCTSQYQCLKFVKRKDGVIELHEGNNMNYETDPCFKSHMLNTKLLIPKDVEPRHCPLQGRYRIHTAAKVCKGWVGIGCNGSSVLDIMSSCSSKPGLQLECLKTWKENKRRYLVARVLGDKTGTTNCFSFKRKDRNWHFAVDNDCNKGAPYILRDFVTYVLDIDKLVCDIPPTSLPSSNQESSQNDEQDRSYQGQGYGGPYQHVDELPRKSSASHTCTITHLTVVLTLFIHYFHFSCCYNCNILPSYFSYIER